MSRSAITGSPLTLVALTTDPGVVEPVPHSPSLLRPHIHTPPAASIAATVP